MKIEILASERSDPEHIILTTTEAVWYDSHRKLLMIDRPDKDGGPLEYGGVKLLKILDHSIVLEGITRFVSGTGAAPTVKVIRIMYL